MPWRVAECLQTLLRQLNTEFPRRSKKSDGSIGDERHQKDPSSDHNPFIKDSKGQGVVRARDFTHDPKTGIDCQWLADTLVANKDPRIDYIIWNRQICSSTKSPWVWRPYKRKNGHTHHLHLSVSKKQSLFDSTTPWKLDFPDNSDADDIARVTDETPASLVTTAPVAIDAAPDAASANAGGSDTTAPTEQTPATDANVATTETQVLSKERPSLFSRVITGVISFFASVLAWFGQDNIASQLATKAANNAVDNAQRSDVETFLLVALYAVLFIGGAVFLLWVASKFYSASAERSNRLNIEKIKEAADPKRNSVELEN